MECQDLNKSIESKVYICIVGPIDDMRCVIRKVGVSRVEAECREPERDSSFQRQ